MIYIFALTNREAIDYARDRRYFGTQWTRVLTSNDLRGRRFEESDELHFTERWLQIPGVKEMAAQVSFVLGLLYPKWPHITWHPNAPMHEWLPVLEAPVHDRLELERWLEA